MSFFSKVWKAVRKVAEPVLRATPIGAAVGQIYDTTRAMRSTGLPGRNPNMSLPLIGAAAGRGLVAAGRRVLPGVVAGAATSAVLDRVTVTGRRSAQPARRRRAKGISGSELKAFKRVTKVLDTYCKVKPPTRSRTYGRSKSCR